MFRLTRQNLGARLGSAKQVQIGGTPARTGGTIRRRGKSIRGPMLVCVLNCSKGPIFYCPFGSSKVKN
jgi:hypothetical protein